MSSKKTEIIELVSSLPEEIRANLAVMDNSNAIPERLKTKDAEVNPAIAIALHEFHHACQEGFTSIAQIEREINSTLHLLLELSSNDTKNTNKEPKQKCTLDTQYYVKVSLFNSEPKQSLKNKNIFKANDFTLVKVSLNKNLDIPEKISGFCSKLMKYINQKNLPSSIDTLSADICSPVMDEIHPGDSILVISKEKMPKVWDEIKKSYFVLSSRGNREKIGHDLQEHNPDYRRLVQESLSISKEINELRKKIAAIHEAQNKAIYSPKNFTQIKKAAFTAR